MNNVILFDDDTRDHLLPLTYTRPMGELRVGILKIKEKWEKWMNAEVSYITQDYLSEKFPIKITSDNFVISGSALPSERLCRLIKQLDPNTALLQNDELIAARLGEKQFQRLIREEEIEELVGEDLYGTPFLRIRNLWDLYLLNDQAIREDFELLTRDRESAPIPASNQVIGAEQVFVEAGAKVECAILNASTGPIYLAADSEVMEGSIVRGPLALCESAVLKLGTKIYGATTIGPHSKVGGEVNNSVIQGFSNKGHDGFLGNSVLGEWCNLGAGTSNSNLKNNYAEVRLWNYESEKFESTGQQFCGLVMGDHSKCGINSMLNTGTVVGVSANLFGSGYPRNFVPSFSWGGASGFSTFQLKKAFEVSERVMARRQQALTEVDRAILSHVFELSASHRRWEKIILQ
ncbi:MAG: GlmU family protein [Bacteroidota bacterium]